jgi:hypothetical protein
MKQEIPDSLRHLQLVNLTTLALLLGRSEKTIKSDLRRAPWRVPPPIAARDWAAPRWLASVVEEWLKNPPPSKKRRGRV